MISIYPPSKKTILCIDHDVSILRYEKALLGRAAYDVLTASSAQKASNLRPHPSAMQSCSTTSCTG
jgi:DNA-binding NtrC family response regulator